MRQEIPMWVAVLVVALVLIIVGIVYWRFTAPPASPERPPIGQPGVPITAQPPQGGGGVSPMPAPAAPGR
ncbi:MAG: hypothetical protein C4295_11830 [Candidatus Fervidibacterota bacterium]